MNLFSVYSQQKEFQDIIEGANKEKWRKAMLWEMETFKEEDNTWLEVDDCPEFVGAFTLIWCCRIGRDIASADYIRRCHNRIVNENRAITEELNMSTADLISQSAIDDPFQYQK
ncbi:hypothetical protein QE152_g25966 [Popillia japonica]|uniref:Uncharacterized protein n=1 Tax=Popillia japonica TaxID=7064 RepID=A0AAW1JZV0_POPJA